MTLKSRLQKAFPQREAILIHQILEHKKGEQRLPIRFSSFKLASFKML